MSEPKPDSIDNIHPSLFFEDGDIRLSANTADGSRQVYKLHRFVLCRASQVFKDMFVVSGTERREEVEMPDRAEDISPLFEAMYSPTYIYALLNTASKIGHSLQPLSALVRISRKYAMEDVAQAVMSHVKAQWPNTLMDWDIRQGVQSVIRASVASGDIGHFRAIFPDPAASIVFAQEFDLPEILPVAFYQLSSINVDCQETDLFYRDLQWRVLDADTLLRLMKGRERIRRYCWDKLFWNCFDLSGRTHSPGCYEARTSLRKEMVSEPSFVTGQIDCLQLFQNTISTARNTWNLCLYCKGSGLLAYIKETRAELWDRLPEFFECKPSQAPVVG
ncbi:hypothetical protein PHLGIDRAFT_358678 [Phlebiopsis gigantea 11061_1 CR5-6]|uniref:BTB domain-containing protein n=1 Tax=Phlebiopsis gigantea (strain 11061_1 CR5-6) TaxID=745531 RepID=A0A0C3PPJ5_PHLG1|nr:hypothetical protein PHLGIDRAFT_358678 [Phlebiopsis gigantea 11061_1 CR5-6]